MCNLKLQISELPRIPGSSIKQNVKCYYKIAIMLKKKKKLSKQPSFKDWLYSVKQNTYIFLTK